MEGNIIQVQFYIIISYFKYEHVAKEGKRLQKRSYITPKLPFLSRFIFSVIKYRLCSKTIICARSVLNYSMKYLKLSYFISKKPMCAFHRAFMTVA